MGRIVVTWDGGDAGDAPSPPKFRGLLTVPAPWIVITAVFIVVLASYWFVLRRSIFILAYHGVGTEPSPVEGLVIRPDAFKSQMRLLAVLGFQNIALDEAVDRL